jgi:predicted DNA binding protein
MSQPNVKLSTAAVAILRRAAENAGQLRVYVRSRELWNVLLTPAIPKGFDRGAGDRLAIQKLDKARLLQKKKHRKASNTSEPHVVYFELTPKGREAIRNAQAAIQPPPSTRSPS